MNIKEALQGYLGKIVFVFILGIFFCLVYLNTESDKNNFIKQVTNKPKVTIGTVARVDLNIKLGVVVKYSFDVMGNTIFSEMSNPRFQNIRLLIYGKTFPVIYSTINPESNYMLILPRDFNDFNVPFPDSLNWVLQYVGK